MDEDRSFNELLNAAFDVVTEFNKLQVLALWNKEAKMGICKTAVNRLELILCAITGKDEPAWVRPQL